MPVDKPTNVNAVVSFDNKTVTDTKAENDRTYTTQESIRKATWSAVVAASIYALIAAYQGCEMRKATVATGGELTELKKSNLQSAWTTRIQQRAWLRCAPDSMNAVIGKQMTNPMHCSIGAGNTPATHVTGNIRGQLLKRDQSPDFVYGNGHPAYHLPNVVMWPGTDMRIALPLYWNNLAHPKNYRPIIFTKLIQSGLESRDMYFVFYGRLDYKDIFKTDHWIQFCSVTMESGGSNECNEYNQTDTNDIGPPN